MTSTRRQFLRSAGFGLAALPVLGAAARPGPSRRRALERIGMCDWNLGPSCDPQQIPKAAEAGLKGIQVSVATRPDHVPLRDPAVRRSYVELGQRHGVSFPSVAAGSILNRIPLQSEPQSAVYVIEAVEAAKALGSHCTLLAFFGNGDLRLRDSMGELRDLRENEPFSEYELNAPGVTRVVEALRQIAPRAEDAGIILGLENTLTARQNLEIIDRVGSDIVQVYYDVGNSTAYGYDVPTEIRLLGNDRICEIHLKEFLGLDDPMRPVLGAPDGGVDFDGVAAACRDIGFDKWYILETSGRDGRFMEDTRANIAFAERHFG